MWAGKQNWFKSARNHTKGHLARASDLSHVNGRTHGRASTHTLVHPLNTCPGDSHEYLALYSVELSLCMCMTGAEFIPL